MRRELAFEPGLKPHDTRRRIAIVVGWAARDAFVLGWFSQVVFIVATGLVWPGGALHAAANDGPTNGRRAAAAPARASAPACAPAPAPVCAPASASASVSASASGVGEREIVNAGEGLTADQTEETEEEERGDWGMPAVHCFRIGDRIPVWSGFRCFLVHQPDDGDDGLVFLDFALEF